MDGCETASTLPAAIHCCWSQGLAQKGLLTAVTTLLSLAIGIWQCHLRLARPELTVGACLQRAYSDKKAV